MAAVDARTCPICGATVPASMWHNCNDHMTPPAAPENRRWAAFTDDELAILYDVLRYSAVGADSPEDDLHEDIEREVLRRGTVPLSKWGAWMTNS